MGTQIMDKQYEPYQEAPRFRFVHPGARAVIGLVAAGAGLAAAALVFGPLADDQTQKLAGVAPQPRPATAMQGTHEVRVAVYRPAAQGK
ncbi:MAG: hypothetical protein ABI330_21125 [Caldimonas sp.]